MLSNMPPPLPFREIFFAAIDQSIAFVEISPEGIILDVNSKYLQMTGYALEEVLGEYYRSTCDAEEILNQDFAEMWNTLLEGKPANGLFRRQRKDGSYFWVEVTYTPLLSELGSVERIMALGFDVDQRQSAVQKKLEWLEALDQVLCILELRHTGEINSVNQAFSTLTGLLPEDIMGKGLSAILSPNFQDSESLWQALRAAHTYIGEVVFQADGSDIRLECAFIPNFDSGGKLQRVIMLGTDVGSRPKRNYLEDLQRTSLAAEYTDAAIMVTGKNRRILYVNGGFVRQYGYEAAEVIGKTPQIIFGHSDRYVVNRRRDDLEHGRSYRADILTYAKDGKCFWSAMHVNPVMGQRGELQFAISILTDITEAKMHEVLLNKSIEAMAHDVSVPHVLNMLCREVEHMVPGVALAIFGIDDSGALTPVAFPSLPHDYAEVCSAPWPSSRLPSTSAAVSAQNVVVVPDLEEDDSDHPCKQVLLTAGMLSCWSMPIKDSNGKPLGAVTFYYRERRDPDVFHLRIAGVLMHVCALALERSRTTSTMRKIAFFDALTGLPNRNLLHTRAQRILSKAKLHNEPVAVFCIGLDRFKRFNDSLGHEAGDMLLRTVAERLTERYRDQAVISRTTSDEFALVLSGCDAEEAVKVAQRIQEMIRVPSTAHGITIITTASLGITLFPDNGTDIAELIRNAELAMHQAKASGRAQFVFFSKEENEKAKAKLSLESHLREAVKERSITLVYQPKVLIGSKALYGVEALSRWYSPELGQVSPAMFIPVAEESGLILEMGRWTIEESCRQMREWQDKGIHVPSVAVNLSPSNFKDEDLPEFILSCLKTHGLQPSHLVLELTENVLLDNDAATLNNIFRAHEMGIRFSMDDFGTGYSSLSYLRQLPVTELKLDKSFVQGIDQDAMSLNLGKAVMHIAESLNLTVVAEGVEKHEEYALLKDLGYHVVQGYYFAPPLSVPDFESWYGKTGSGND